MHKIPVICLLFLALIVMGECIELPGGETRSISGQNSIGTASGQPVYNYPRGSFSVGNPSNYVVPAVKIPPYSPNSQESSSNANISQTTTTVGTLGFAMTSDVEGTGSFAICSHLKGKNYQNTAHQFMNAKYGNLSQSRNLSYYADSQSDLGTDTGTMDYALAKIDMRDSTIFLGQSYFDITELKNKNTLIQDDFTRAGAISKESAYSSQAFNLNLDDADDAKELLNNYIVYSIDSKFIGTSNLHAITNNDEVDQYHVGQFALKRDIVSQQRYNNTPTADSWLNCCPGGYLTMPKDYQTGGTGFGSDLRALFDCTYPKWNENAEYPSDSGLTPVRVGRELISKLNISK